ncbi:MAG: lipopolysaccharide kinase InaA family protein [Flavobacteriaceae bacterium]
MYYNFTDLRKILFSETYRNRSDSIIELVDNFQQIEGINIGDGDRNTIMAFQMEGLLLNVKSFKIPNLINKIIYRFFRKSKAQRSFENATRLLEYGMGTPNPIAFLEFYKGPFFDKSFYVSEQLNIDFTFRELIHNPTVSRREEIIRKFTKFTFQLHEHGVLFKDHSPGNTLIKMDGDTIKFYLVDLNRMEFKSLSFEERIKNFCRLTPLKDMVEMMSAEYAKLIHVPYDEVFTKMWKETEKFQNKFHRKRRLKKQLLFWRK